MEDLLSNIRNKPERLYEFLGIEPKGFANLPHANIKGSHLGQKIINFSSNIYFLKICPLLLRTFYVN